MPRGQRPAPSKTTFVEHLWTTVRSRGLLFSISVVLFVLFLMVSIAHMTTTVSFRTPKSRDSSHATPVSRQSGGYEHLKGCTLRDRSFNDGDSFLVFCPTQQREYLFRLYFVDCLETSLKWSERVRDQATYFGVTSDEVVRVGQEAARHTTELLRSRPFSVFTRWETVYSRCAYCLPS